MHAGQLDVALRCLTGAVEASSAETEDDVTIHASLNITTALAQLGRHKEALQMAEQVVALLVDSRAVSGR